VQNSGKDALSRRAFVGKLATGAAGAAVAFAATKGAAKAVPHADSNGAVTNAAIGLSPGEANRGPILDALQDKAATAPPPWQIMAPLAAGSVVAADWRIVDLTAVADGSCTLTLGNRNDRTHRVHLCRNGGEPRGLVYTEQFDLVVMNGGRGDLPTEEGFGLAVASVAHAIAANEASGGAAEVASALMTHTEREQRFADSARLR
jgi:hypothetical protein